MNWKAMFTDGNGDPSWSELTAIGGTVLAGIMSCHSYFVRHAIWDPQAFGIGLGAIVAAIGAAQRLRGDPERDKSNQAK